MHRIDDPTAVPTLPAPRVAGTPGYFTGGSPGSSGFAATVVRYEWMNAVQEELSHVIEAGAITLDKTNNGQLLLALQKLFIPRTVVTSNMTIFVNPSTGNDSNNGLTSGTAFLTIQAAINAVYNFYNWNGFGCTIQLADGTYNYSTPNGFAASFFGTPFGMQPGALKLQGNVPAPNNVKIVAVNSNCISVARTQIALAGITMSASGTVNTIYQYQGTALALNQSAWVDVQACQFQSCGSAQIQAVNSSVVTLQGVANAFNGATPRSMWVYIGGMIWFPGATLNVTGLTFSGAFATAGECGIVEAAGASFIGSATGPRYDVHNNGVIICGGSPTFFPGNAAGLQVTGGQYS